MPLQASNYLPDVPEHLGTTIVAAGALGTAAFGIVEGLKSTAAVGEAGFPKIIDTLGVIAETLKLAYGTSWETLLRAQYRGDQRELKRLLRQGVRVGLNDQNADKIAAYLGAIDGAALTAAVRKAATATAANRLSDADRAVIGRFELAADARIDAGLCLAQARYAATARWYAFFIAIGIAMGVAAMMGMKIWFGLAVGIVAVPLAPIAKDVASGISAASRALRAKV